MMGSLWLEIAIPSQSSGDPTWPSWLGRPDGRPWRDQKIAAPPISDIAHTVEEAVIRLPCRPDDRYILYHTSA